MQSDKVIICALLYGDHHDLHKRLLDSFLWAVKPETQVRFWCNQVCPATVDFLQRMPPNYGVISFSTENTPKYKVMRHLFDEVKAGSWDWVVWFDDDSYLAKADWFDQTAAWIDSKKDENVCYVGQPWFVHHLPGQAEFIAASSWYTGKPIDKVQGRSAVHFAQGAYWWLRTDILRSLDWPDRRLSHNGGDTLLGQAIQQQGLPFHKQFYGVKINDSKRRGLSEVPAGASNPHARR